MTVAELIEHLSTLPPEIKIMIWRDNGSMATDYGSVEIADLILNLAKNELTII